VVVRWSQIRKIGWVIKTLEAQVRRFILGGKCPVRRGTVVQEQDPLGDLPARGISLQNVLQLHQQRCIILRVESLALWKISNEDAVVIPKISRRELYKRIFALVIFGVGRGEQLCRHSNDCCFLCLRVIVI
jgi:hypothetical protein